MVRVDVHYHSIRIVSRRTACGDLHKPERPNDICILDHGLNRSSALFLPLMLLVIVPTRPFSHLEAVMSVGPWSTIRGRRSYSANMWPEGRWTIIDP